MLLIALSDVGTPAGVARRLCEVDRSAGSFWEFQFIEAGIFGGLSALCLGFTLWWVRGRLR